MGHSSDTHGGHERATPRLRAYPTDLTDAEWEYLAPHLPAESDHVKVADFGIARAVEATTISHTGDILGSAKYMSPEQAAGRELADAT